MNGTGAQSLRRMTCSGSPDVQTLTSGNSWNTLQMQVLDGLFGLRVPSVTYEADAFVLQHAALHNLTIGREDLFKLSGGNIPIELADEESALFFFPVLSARLIDALTAGRCGAFRFSSRFSPGGDQTPYTSQSPRDSARITPRIVQRHHQVSSKTTEYEVRASDTPNTHPTTTWKDTQEPAVFTSHNKHHEIPMFQRIVCR